MVVKSINKKRSDLRWLSFYRHLDALFKNKIIPMRYRKDIDQIREYRNSIVHGRKVPLLAELSEKNLLLEKLLEEIQENINIRL